MVKKSFTFSRELSDKFHIKDLKGNIIKPKKTKVYANGMMKDYQYTINVPVKLIVEDYFLDIDWYNDNGVYFSSFEFVRVCPYESAKCFEPKMRRMNHNPFKK